MHVIVAQTFYHFLNKLKTVGLWHLLFVLIFATACVSIEPVEEYTLARTALAAAKKAQAPKYASGHWVKAEEIYKQAQQNYSEREFELAREEFLLARTFAEKAESKARLRLAVTGED